MGESAKACFFEHYNYGSHFHKLAWFTCDYVSVGGAPEAYGSRCVFVFDHYL